MSDFVWKLDSDTLVKCFQNFKSKQMNAHRLSGHAETWFDSSLSDYTLVYGNHHVHQGDVRKKIKHFITASLLHHMFDFYSHDNSTSL